MRSPTRCALRSLAGGLGYAIVTVVAAALLSEAVLQAGAWWIRSSRPEVASRWLGDSFRILCVGDSNTYGVYLDDRAGAWPARLESLWNASGRSPRIETMNLGYPGTSSSLLLRHLPEMLETSRPDLLLVMVGANDFWTAPTPLEREGDRPFSWWRFVERHSRLHRLVYLALQSARSGELVVDTSATFPKAGKGRIAYGGREFEMQYHWGPQPRSVASRELKLRLAAIAEEAAAAGVQLVLLTYPSRQHDYARANQSIRTVARQQQLDLIDLAADFARVCPDEICEELFVRDQHPNANGYRVAAELLAERLSELPAGPRRPGQRSPSAGSDPARAQQRGGGSSP